jgi:hypothetical protein
VQPFNKPAGGDNTINIGLDEPSLPLRWLWAKAQGEWS